MPKKRVIAAIIVRQGWAVQSFGFARWLPVGRPEIAARFFGSWGADEIVVLDIDASREGRTIDPALVARIAHQVQVPLTAGGGLRSAEDVREVVQAGADKVAMNQAAFDVPAGVHEAVEAFGTQCIIGAMDVRRGSDGVARVFAGNGQADTGLDPVAHAAALARLGVGEILVNSIDRDGAGAGYDTGTALAVARSVAMPVIVLGGAGHPAHLHDVLRHEEIAAAAAANFFNHTEHAIGTAKAWLKGAGIDIRLENWADYSQYPFDEGQGRLLKKPDAVLDDEIFEFVAPEVI